MNILNRDVQYQFNLYDAFEVKPCQVVGLEDDGTQIIEPLEDTHTPEEVDFWTVYGHRAGQGVTALADCPTEAVANLILLSLNHTVRGQRL
jgi:hypothetical protein